MVSLINLSENPSSVRPLFLAIRFWIKRTSLYWRGGKGFIGLDGCLFMMRSYILLNYSRQHFSIFCWPTIRLLSVSRKHLTIVFLIFGLSIVSLFIVWYAFIESIVLIFLSMFKINSDIYWIGFFGFKLILNLFRWSFYFVKFRWFCIHLRLFN